MSVSIKPNDPVMVFDSGFILTGVVEAEQNGLYFVRHPDELEAVSYYPECLVLMN